MRITRQMGKFVAGASTATWASSRFPRAHRLTRPTCRRTANARVTAAIPIAASSVVRSTIVAPASSILAPPQP